MILQPCTQQTSKQSATTGLEAPEDSLVPVFPVGIPPQQIIDMVSNKLEFLWRHRVVNFVLDLPG